MKEKGKWQTAAEAIIADRKKANQVGDIIEAVEGAKDPKESTAVTRALLEVFSAWCRAEEKRIKKSSSEGDGDEVFEKWNKWLRKRAEEAMAALSKASISSDAVWVAQELSLVGWFRLMMDYNKLRVDQGKTEKWDSEQTRLFGDLIKSALSCDNNGEKLCKRLREYTAHSDVKEQTVNALAATLKDKSVPKDSKFRLNLLSILESLDMDQSVEDTPALVLGSEICHSVSYEELKKPFSKVWESYLRMEHEPSEYKRILVILDEKVMPHLTRPLLLTDFLVTSYNVGGVISVLSLGGVFALIRDHNLEYPDFYAKLYALFTPDVLHAKYRARFLHLSDIMLTSSHVPEYLVAAFAKRLARISLRAPANAILATLPFIANLLIRHRGLSKMLYGSEDYDVSGDKENLEGDPYVEEEADPAKCRAAESSLWEVVALQNHVLPQVAAAAKKLCSRMPPMEFDLSEFLEISMEEMMAAETRKKVFVNVPLTFERPLGLRAAKGDLTSKYFKLA